MDAKSSETRTYWLDLFTWQTWQEFLKAGGSVSGWRDGRRRMVQEMRPGDLLVCYLTGVSRFVGLLEVTSDAFEDESEVWSEEAFPWRVHVRPVAVLTPETAVPVKELLSYFTWADGQPDPAGWTGHFRGSPARMRTEDGTMVAKAIEDAVANPLHREVDRRKLARKARVWSGRRPVSIPDKEPESQDGASPNRLSQSADAPFAGPEPEADESNAHTEIQHLLLRLGSDMGLGVWVARNDRGREYNGQSLANVPNLRDELPRQFDEDTSRTIRLIDVLWLRRDTIVGAFEIEKSTTIYSGLLRMADLVALQPNLNIPLYIVAPNHRREKVREEINRPVFSRALEPPLSSTCRYISFDALRSEVSRVGSLVKHLKPDFIFELSEDCSLSAGKT